MARYNFGGDLASFTILAPSGQSNVVKAQPNATGSVYAARTGGSALTDLLDHNGAAASSITSDADGFVRRFQGPSGYTNLWADFGGGSRFHLRTVDDAFPHKDVERVNVLDHGVVDSPSLDQSTAIQAVFDAYDNVYFPDGDYLANNLVVSGKTNFKLDMVGRLKRPDNAARLSIIRFVNCTDTRIGTIRTDGNAANNQLAVGGTPFPVDEAKHDIRLENCAGFTVDVIDSLNPAGDTLYIAGGLANNTTDVQVGTVRSHSTAHTGRNAVSVIKGQRMQFGRVLSYNTGFPGNTAPAVIAMPSGFDIEPNLSTDVVTDITVGQIVVTSAGGVGLGIYSNYGKIITNVEVGSATITKTASTRTGSGSVIIKGATRVKVGDAQINGAGIAGALSVDDSDDVAVDLHAVNCGGNGMILGVNAAVDNFRLTGMLDGATDHCLVIYSANKGLVDMTLRNQGAGDAVLVKNSTGTSSDVMFRGNWAKGTTGAQLVNSSAASGITNWVLDGVDATGYGTDTRFKGGGAALLNISARNCLGINFGTGVPAFDAWSRGTIIWNTAPAASTTPGWICVTAGTPGTWKAMANLAA